MPSMARNLALVGLQNVGSDHQVIPPVNLLHSLKSKERESPVRHIDPTLNLGKIKCVASQGL